MRWGDSSTEFLPNLNEKFSWRINEINKWVH